MINGLESPQKLLNKYIKDYTTCIPGNNGFPFTTNEPELPKLIIEVPMTGFDWERLQKGRLVLYLLPFSILTYLQMKLHSKK